MNAQELLDQLAEFYAQRQLLDLEKQEQVDKILTPEIKAQIADINLEFGDKAQAVNENIAALEAAVKEAVLQGGASVKGAYLQAVWSKGRISWDSRMLDGMIALVPQLATARKEGEPSVSIRKI